MKDSDGHAESGRARAGCRKESARKTDIELVARAFFVYAGAATVKISTALAAKYCSVKIRTSDKKPFRPSNVNSTFLFRASTHPIAFRISVFPAASLTAMGTTSDTRRSLRITLLAAGTPFLDGFSTASAAFLISLVPGLSALEVALFTSLFLLGSFVGAFAVAPLGDRLGRRPVFLASVFSVFALAALAAAVPAVRVLLCGVKSDNDERRLYPLCGGLWSAGAARLCVSEPPFRDRSAHDARRRRHGCFAHRGGRSRLRLSAFGGTHGVVNAFGLRDRHFGFGGLDRAPLGARLMRLPSAFTAWRPCRLTGPQPFGRTPRPAARA